MLITATSRPPNATYPAGILSTGLMNAEAILQGVAFSEEAIAIPPYAGDTVTISLDLNGNEINYLFVNGTIYDRVAESPTQGQYSYNPETGDLVVGGGDLIGSAVYSVATSSVSTDILINQFPPAIAHYFADGNIAYNFADQPPSFSLSLACRKADKAAYLSAFIAGASVVRAGGNSYRLRSRSVTEEYRSNLVTISLDWDGIHAPYGTNFNGLDKPILVKELLNGQDECTYKYRFSDVFLRSGVAFSGRDIEVKVGRDVSDKETITARELLGGDLPLVAGAIVRWDRNSVEVVSPDSTAVHYLSESMIIGDLTFQYGGNGDIINGVPLVTQYQNTVLELDDDPHKNGEGDDEQVVVNKSSPNPLSPPLTHKGGYFESFDANNLRSMSWAFDNGGKTDYVETVKTINGTIIETVKNIYGFVYTSADCYNIVTKQFNAPSPDNLWQQVRRERIETLFDDEGYETDKRITGWELQRGKQESDALEVIELLQQLNEGGLTSEESDRIRANLLLYGYDAIAGTAFQRVAINATTTHTLEPLKKYYLDTPDPDNSDQVVPRFANRTLSAEDTLTVVPDPESVEGDEKPPIAFGRFQREEQQVQILSAKRPEKFQSTTIQTTKEGTGLAQFATAYEIQQSDGRPSPHPRLERKNCRHTKQADDSNAPSYKYLISSGSNPSYDTEGGTIRFTGAYTLEQALAAAKLRARIDNMDALTVTVNLKSATQWRVWDSVFWRGLQWKVMNVSRGELSQNGLHSLTQFTVTLKVWPNIPVAVKTVPVN